MPKLVVTFRDRSTAEFPGTAEQVDDLSDRIRDAMAKSLDTVISHDLAGEPADFLCSDVAHVHIVPDPES